MDNELFCRIRLVGTNLYYDRRKGSLAGETTNLSLTGNFYQKSNVQRVFDDVKRNTMVSDKQVEKHNLGKIVELDYTGKQKKFNKKAIFEVITYRLLQVENEDI